MHNVQFRKAKILTHINLTFLCYLAELCRWIAIVALCKWSETLLVLFCIFDRFCRRHRLRTGENVPSIPRDLLLMSEMVLPRFIMCIIQYLREGYIEPGEGILQNIVISISHKCACTS